MRERKQGSVTEFDSIALIARLWTTRRAGSRTARIIISSWRKMVIKAKILISIKCFVNNHIRSKGKPKDERDLCRDTVS